MFKFKLLALSVMLAVAGQVNAAGIPVLDAAALTQNIKDFTQHLKDYEQMIRDYKQQILAYERQVKDATRPYAELYESVYNGYDEIMRVADNIKNMQSEYNTTMDYIKNRYGDSSFWKQCELTSCNPEVFKQTVAQHVNQSATALSSSRQEQESVLGVNAATKKEIANLLSEMRNNESKLSQAGDEGVAATLQLMGKINAQCGQLLALNTSVMQQYSAAQAADNMAKAADAQAQKEYDDQQFKKMLDGFKADGLKKASKHQTWGGRQH